MRNWCLLSSYLMKFGSEFWHHLRSVILLTSCHPPDIPPSPWHPMTSSLRYPVGRHHEHQLLLGRWREQVIRVIRQFNLIFIDQWMFQDRVLKTTSPSELRPTAGLWTSEGADTSSDTSYTTDTTDTTDPTDQGCQIVVISWTPCRATLGFKGHTWIDTLA